MAYNFGKSENRTIAEKLRLDHGPFIIPYPSHSSRQEMPFGLTLAGSGRIDYERIQIRIAALQHGLKVLVNHNGKVVLAPNSSSLGQGIKSISDQLDWIYLRFYKYKRIVTPKDCPVGFYSSHWRNPREVQTRIPRHRREIMRAFADFARCASIVQRRRLGQAQASHPGRLVEDSQRVIKYMERLMMPEDFSPDNCDQPLSGLVHDHTKDYPVLDSVTGAHDKKVFRAMLHRLRDLAEGATNEPLNRPVKDYARKIIVKQVVDRAIQMEKEGLVVLTKLRDMYRDLRAGQANTNPVQHPAPQMSHQSTRAQGSNFKYPPTVEELRSQAEFRMILAKICEEHCRWFKQTWHPSRFQWRQNFIISAAYNQAAALTAEELETELTDAEFNALVENM
ncbi:hypothetical protein PRK78_003170 [Emydomyces testavorans]|uniref:Uncharacterized protein n=1 Tax=Emydomyces testavorans TaxID=2070801 RepID=A0AAF0II57_9EURO|nr:hypothetical protein PRK78_003170 [Emydomyces testavorans]